MAGRMATKQNTVESGETSHLYFPALLDDTCLCTDLYYERPDHNRN